MDFGASYKHQQRHTSYGSATGSPSPEVLMNYPEVILPPPRYPHYHSPMGRNSRRKKPKQSRFYHQCSLHFNRQFYPRELDYNTRQNNHGNHTSHFGLKENKSGIDYSWSPRSCIAGAAAHNFSPNVYQFDTCNYALAPEGCYKEQMYAPDTAPKLARSESAIEMEHLTPMDCHMNSSKIQSYNSKGPRPTRNNAMQRKRKKYFSKERVSNQSSVIGVSTDSNFEIDDDLQSYEFNANGNAATAGSTNVATAVSYGDKTTFGEMFPSETQLAVENLIHSQLDDLPNLDQSCEKFQENKESKTATLYADNANVSASLNSEVEPDAFSLSLLNDIFSGIGEADTSENKNANEDKEETNASSTFNDLLPYSGSGSNTFETTINIPIDPITSLIQQNQILIDLLSKIINNSDVFKVANENKTLVDTFAFQEPDQKSSETDTSSFQKSGVKIVQMDDSPFCPESGFQSFEQTILNLNEETEKMTETNSDSSSAINSLTNETEYLSPNSDSLINYRDGHEIHNLDSVFDKNRLDSSNKEFVKVEKHESAFANDVLVKSTTKYSNEATVDLENMKNQIEDGDGTATTIERDEVNTVVTKSSVQKKIVSTMKSVDEYIVKNLKRPQVNLKPLSGYDSDSSSVNCGRQKQNENNSQVTEAVLTDDFNVCSKKRKLRSSTKCDQQIESEFCLQNFKSEVNHLEKDKEKELHALPYTNSCSVKRYRIGEKNDKVLKRESGPNVPKRNSTSKRRSNSKKF